MKKNQINFRKMIAGVVIVSAFACSVACIVPSPFPFEGDKGEKAANAPDPVKSEVPATPVSEEVQLVHLLANDGLIDEIKGFLLEKRQNKLYINGVQLADDIAAKYTVTLKKDEIRVQVFPIMERLKQHPDVGLLQILFPVSLSSPCVDNKPKKPGC